MTLLPFDNATIGGTSVPASQVIPGSGSYQETGRDITTTTADGRLYHDRQAILRRARLEARGDLTSLDSANGSSQPIILRRGDTLITTFTGLVTATYQARRHVTTLTIAGDPLSS